MGTVTTALKQEAESIFTNLGYAVETTGGEIRAERKWRVVQVTPMPEPDEPPETGEMRCFVTWEDNLDTLERRLTRANLDYEWAIIGIREGDDYTVSRGS